MRVVEIDSEESSVPRDDDTVALVWHGGVPLGAICGGSADLPRFHESESMAGIAPTLSVVVCSRDRPLALRGALSALAEQRQRPDELLVIDNASADERTREVAEEAGARCIFEPRAGVRFARNRGLAEASGDVVAFMDDDCRPVAGWVAAIRHAFTCNCALACCTGPVVSGAIETEAQYLMEVRGGFSKGFERRLFTRESHVAQWRHYPLQAWMFGTGANMAFARKALIDAGGFAEDLPWGEDLDAFFRILRAGHALAYEPCATVLHDHVREHAALKRRLYRWGYGYSAFLARVGWEEPLYRRKALEEIFGFLSYQFRERWWASLRGRDSFPRDLATAELLGALMGLAGYWHDRRRARSR